MAPPGHLSNTGRWSGTLHLRPKRNSGDAEADAGGGPVLPVRGRPGLDPQASIQDLPPAMGSALGNNPAGPDHPDLRGPSAVQPQRELLASPGRERSDGDPASGVQESGD